jgi:hypothetical protein
VYPQQNGSSETTAQIDSDDSSLWGLSLFPENVWEGRFKAVHHDLLSWTMVVGRLKQRVSNVLQMDPTVEDASLLKTVVGALTFRTPPHLLPLLVTERSQPLERDASRLTKKIKHFDPR